MAYVDILDGDSAAGILVKLNTGLGAADTAVQPANIASGTITPKTGDLDLNGLGTAVQSGGALNTPSSGTLTNCTGLPESGLATTDVTTGDTSTTKHGFAPKAVAPASGNLTALAIANGETAITNKVIFEGCQKIAVVDAMPGTPNATTLYLVY